MEYNINSDERVSHAVTRGVSITENTTVSDLPALYESVDPEALDVLFKSEGNIYVSFAYSNSLVDVYNGEYLTVEATLG
jgi:hypothetical protein